jgi:epoxyqueuosine reductase QueG
MGSLEKEIKRKCGELGIPLVGISSVKRWETPPSELPHNFNEWIPSDFWPHSIFPEANSVIVIGLPVTLPIVDTAPSIYYHELYYTVNNILDEDAYKLANYLTEKSHPSLFLPRDGYGDIHVLLKKPLAFFSHKHAAYLAGLGTFGLNNVLLTPEYGPRVRFTSIFTMAELEPSPVLKKELCIRCLKCAECCPADAISTNGNFPPPMDKIKCAERSRELRETFNNPCGICIKVCPIGEDRKIFKRTNNKMYTDEDRFDKYHRSWKHIKSYGSR